MTEATTVFTELMSRKEVIAYLRLDHEGGDAPERLRNLIRRHRLPVLKRGGVTLFRRSAIDAWLEGESRTRRMKHPARLPAK